MFYLTEKALPALPEDIRAESYDRAAITTGIVHLGFGGFHRAHMARYTHDLLRDDFNAAKNWGIVGVGLMPTDERMRDSLEPQNGLYTLIEREGREENITVIGAAPRILFAGAHTVELLKEIEKPETRIVSLTVTENGYCLNPDTRGLDLSHPAIAADLANPRHPRTAVGIIAESYRRRMESGAPAFTALSCDNIQGNGHVLRHAVMSYAEQVSPALAGWIESKAKFPNTMVDRITPVTKPEDIAYLESKGLHDNWPVVSEIFRQWVIEDDFAQGRPAWEKVGAQFVENVEPYEIMKLRLLNASHLAVACLGDLAGYTHIDQTMADPQFRTFMRDLMDRETGPTLPPVPGVDLDAYKQKLLDRFANPAIKDTTLRVATDAPLNAILMSMRDRLKNDESIELLSLALAGWMKRVAGGKNEAGQDIVVRHPQAELLKQKAAEGGPDPRPLLSITSLFGDLANDSRVISSVGRSLAALYQAPVKQVLRPA